MLSAHKGCFPGKLNSQVTVGNWTGSALLTLAGWVLAVAFGPKEAQWKQRFWWAFINLLQSQKWFKAKISSNVTSMWHCGAESMRRQRSHNNRANSNRITVKASKFCAVYLQNGLRSAASKTFEKGGQQNEIFWTRTENHQALFKGEPSHGSRSWLFFFFSVSLSGACMYLWKTVLR